MSSSNNGHLNLDRGYLIKCLAIGGQWPNIVFLFFLFSNGMGNLKAYPFLIKKALPFEYIKTPEFFELHYDVLNIFTLYKNIDMTFFSIENLLPIWLDKPCLVKQSHFFKLWLAVVLRHRWVLYSIPYTITTYIIYVCIRYFLLWTRESELLKDWKKVNKYTCYLSNFFNPPC